MTCGIMVFIREPSSPSTQQNLAKSFAAEGDGFFKARNFEKALERYTVVVELVLRRYGEDHPELAVSLYARGRVLFELRRFPEVLECFTKALQIWQALDGVHPVSLAGLFRGRGEALFILGSPQEALTDLQIALGLFIKFFGCNHVEVIETQQKITEINAARRF